MRESWRQTIDSFRRISPVVVIFCVAFSAVWVWTALFLRFDSPTWWAFVKEWGLDNEALSQGRFYTLFSYGFVHVGVGHYLANLFILIMFGQRLSMLVGSKPLLLLTAISLPLGGACQLLMNQFGTDLLLIGASPIGFAWALAWMGLDPDARTFGLSFRILAPATVGACLVLAVVSAFPSFKMQFMSSIWITSHAAHFGGALVGWLWALWWMNRKPVSLKQLKAQRLRREG